MEAKGFSENAFDSGLTDEDVLDSRPLYAEFDPSSDGGVAVAEDGTVFELRHPFWATGENPNLASRVTVLPYTLNEEERLYGDQPNDDNFSRDVGTSMPVPWLASFGKEVELGVQRPDGQWHHFTKTGETMIAADGTEYARPNYIDPEAYKHMAEYDTGIAYGTDDLKLNSIAAAAKTERLLESLGLYSPYNSVHPEDTVAEDVTDQAYVRKVESRMVSMREFTGNSGQLHVHMIDEAAAMHALNHYQRFQGLTSLITAAAPVRDARFDQTIDGHFNQPGAHDTTDGFDLPNLYSYPDLQSRAEEVPYDWREISRTGSPSAGVIRRVAEPGVANFLRDADASMRDGGIVSSAREYGQHSDRVRLDLGTIEICNLGTSGGNLHRITAVDALVSKYMLAEQMRYLQLSPAERAAEKQVYAQSLEAGKHNSMAMTIDGKQARFNDIDVELMTPGMMLKRMVATIEAYGPSKLEAGELAELSAGLEPVDPTRYGSAAEVFEAALQPLSPLTNTDALRLAHQLEPETPANDLLLQYAKIRRQHTYEMEALHVEPARNVRLGNIATTRLVDEQQ